MKDHLKKGRPSEPCKDRNIVGVPTGCLKGLYSMIEKNP